MTNSSLKTDLQPIVQKYGLGVVLKSLGEIADAQRESPEQRTASPNNVEGRTKRTRARVTAPEYVEKMELSEEKSAAIKELAKRFHQKSFLPTFGAISHFCQMYAIEMPSSRSRESAIPRIFKFITEMEASEIQRILDNGLFSGPSRLGPISDAIRNYSRA